VEQALPPVRFGMEDNQSVAPDSKDIEIIACNAKRLNREAREVLEYQHYPSLRALTSQDIHKALFGDEKPQPRTLGELKEGIRAHIRRRHALR
jgi:hypothetical protein